MTFNVDRICNNVRKVMGQPDGPLPLHIPTFSKNAETYALKCVTTGWVSSVGQYVDQFEEMLASYTAVERAVAVVNGTSALHIALLLCGVQPKDEVLLPSLTFVATANAVSYCHATPNFIDVSTATLGVDATKLEQYLEEHFELRDGVCHNLKTDNPVRALIGMHAFGHPFDVAQVKKVCGRYNLKLIEDAAESIGSFYHGKHTGGLADVGIVSFNGNKTITTGGGGAILLNDASLGDHAKHLTTTGKVPHPYRYVHDVIAYNYRMPNINAALGVSQLEDLEELVATKRDIAARYIDVFSDESDFQILAEPKECRSNYWLNALVLDKPLADQQDAIIKGFHERQIYVRPIWEPLHNLSMFKNCPRMDLSNTLDLASRVINLPSTPTMVSA